MGQQRLAPAALSGGSLFGPCNSTQTRAHLHWPGVSEFHQNPWAFMPLIIPAHRDLLFLPNQISSTVWLPATYGGRDVLVLGDPRSTCPSLFVNNVTCRYLLGISRPEAVDVDCVECESCLPE